MIPLLLHRLILYVGELIELGGEKVLQRESGLNSFLSKQKSEVQKEKLLTCGYTQLIIEKYENRILFPSTVLSY